MISLLLSVSMIVAPSAATQPAREKDVLAQAADVLTAEYRAVLADPEKPVRTTCNFFKENPPPISIRAAAVLSLVEKRRQPKRADDVRVECYVKWQLLSAFDGKFEDKLTKRAIEAYRRTPLLMARPGSSPSDQQVLESLARGRTDTEQEAIEYKLDQPMSQFNAYNSPLLHLRDALYERLPPQYESVAAGFDDLNERVACAIEEVEFQPLAEQLVADATTWMNSSTATPEQLSSVAAGVEKLIARRTMFYTGLRWRDAERRLEWRKRTIEPDRRGTLGELARSLQSRAESLKQPPPPATQTSTSQPSSD